MRPRHPLAIICTVAAVIALSGASLVGQNVALQYHWTKGDALRYRVTQESDVTMSGIPGVGDMTVTTTTTQMQQLTAAAVAADGAATVNALFESVRMDMASPMGSMTYDSTSPTPPTDPTAVQVGNVLGAMVGETITVVIARNGAIRSVTGASALLDKVKSRMPASPAGVDPLANLNAMMSDEAMKSAFGQSFANLPDGPVKPGDTWTNEIKMPNPAGTMTVANTFTMKGVDTVAGREVTHIGFVQKITGAPEGGMMGPMTVKVGNGTGEGEMLFDHVHGRVVSTTGQSTIPMNMSMVGPDGSAISLDASTVTKIRMELIER